MPNSNSTATTHSIMAFPCHVPVTVLGIKQDGFAQSISDCVSTVVQNFDPSTIEMRPSKAGNYLAVAFSVYVHSKQELELLNAALKEHPMVKIVL